MTYTILTGNPTIRCRHIQLIMYHFRNDCLNDMFNNMFSGITIDKPSRFFIYF